MAQIVVDAARRVVTLNQRVRSLFGLHDDDVGRPLRELRVFSVPVELGTVMDRVEAERYAIEVKEVEWHTESGEVRWLDLTASPVLGSEGRVLGVLATFTEVTSTRRLQRELEQLHRQLEAAQWELQSTNGELERTREELQSTMEALETTNAGLQSSNAELETITEELRSASEELETINDSNTSRAAP